MSRKSLKQFSELTLAGEHVVGEVVAGKLVAEKGKVLEVLPGVILERDLTGEEVVAEVKVAEEGHGSKGEKNFQGTDVVGEV